MPLKAAGSAQTHRATALPGGEAETASRLARTDHDEAAAHRTDHGSWPSTVGVGDEIASLREAVEMLRLAQLAGGVGAFRRDIQAGVVHCTAETQELHGLAPGPQPVPYDRWLSVILPEDLDRVRQAVAEAMARHQATLQHEYRIRMPDGETRHVEVRVRFAYALDGTPLAAIGVLIDATARKLAEERHTMLVREVDHRARNVLSVVLSVLALTRSDDPDDYAETVRGRVAALARAHTLLARERWSGASLRTLLLEELAPFGGGDAERIAFEGPVVALHPTAAQPVAMIVHELATNAAKHGALSWTAGRLRVRWHREADNLILRWEENGGPPIAGPPSRRGFGSSLLERTLRHQLGATAELAWHSQGLVCTIRFPLSRVETSHAVCGPA